MSSFKRADGGVSGPAPFAFRVEITICCPQDHLIVPFYRMTLPEMEHEGVTYDRGRIGRGAILTGEGDDWRLMYLRCGQCTYGVRVSRRELEIRLAAMWAPYAKRHGERVVWDSP